MSHIFIKNFILFVWATFPWQRLISVAEKPRIAGLLKQQIRHLNSVVSAVDFVVGV
jgi:hypothetical protein